jgi:hypothetical protein
MWQPHPGLQGALDRDGPLNPGSEPADMAKVENFLVTCSPEQVGQATLFSSALTRTRASKSCSHEAQRYS